MTARLPLALAFSLSLTLLAGSGCTLVKGTLQLPDLMIQALLPFSNRDKPPDAVEVQSLVIRFSDHYLEAVTRNMRYLKRDGKPIEPRELTRRRIQYTNDVLAIATGSNAFANLLDLVVLVTLTRMRVEGYWQAQPNDASRDRILKVFKEADSQVWRISASILTPDQQLELRTSLANWLKKNPKLRLAPDMSDLDFVAAIRDFSQSRRSAAPASVFNLLMIDPLSGLDPAAKELAETRLMAERAIFLSRHLPELIRWETEYLTMNTLDNPEIQKLLNDTTHLAESANRFSQVTEKLPEVIASERAQLVATLKSERQGLTALAAESRSALTAGKQMADAANASLKSFQAVVSQLQAQPSDPRSEPFRIGDYIAAAAEISKTSERLVELLGAFNQTLAPDHMEQLSARADALSRQVESRSRAVVDYAYRKALMAGALLCALVLATALLYQLLAAALKRALTRRDAQPG